MPKVKFSNLKNLKLKNTSELTKLKSNLGIESVELAGSKILTINTLRKQVPEVLLSRNNMADYTMVNLNGQPVSESNIEKLKAGYMRVNNGDAIEILNGCLAGHIFIVKVGVPIRVAIKDRSIADHVKDLLGKYSLDEEITGYDLDTIQWLGKDPETVTDSDYYGYFRGKVISTFEDLKLFKKLEYINFAGALIPKSLNTKETGSVKNFRYSFADCVSLNDIVLEKQCIDTSYSFKGCTGISNISMTSEFGSLNADGMFKGCVGILELTVPSDSSKIIYTHDVFENGRIESLKLESSTTYNDISFFQTAVKIAKKIDLRGHGRIDLLTLTTERNTSVNEINFNSSLIEECVLKGNPKMNFSGLQRVYLNDTPNLRKIVASDNLYNMYVDNSGILSIRKLHDRKIELLTDLSNLHYFEIQINGQPVAEDTLELIKSGEYDFTERCTIKFIDGVLAGYEINYSCYSEIPQEGLRAIEVFVDNNVAHYVSSQKLGLSSYNEFITQDDLDTIVFFGSNRLNNAYYDSSDFNNVEVSTWQGVEFLRNLKSIFLKGYKGTADYFDMSNLTELENLNACFFYNGVIKRIKMPKHMNKLKSMNYFLHGCYSDELTLPETMDNLLSMNYSLGGFAKDYELTFPISLPNCISAESIFTGQAPIKVVLPKYMPKVETLNIGTNHWDNLEEIYFPELCTLVSSESFLVNRNYHKLKKVYLSPNMPNLINKPMMESNGTAEITFYKDDSVTELTTLPFHNEFGRPLPENFNYVFNYSRLENIPIPLGRISDVFPDTLISEYIAAKLNKDSTEDSVTKYELQSISSFGYTGTGIPINFVNSSYSYFYGKTISTFKGIEHLTRLEYILLSGSIFEEIDISHLTTLKSLASSFSLTSAKKIILPDTFNPITSLHGAFAGCLELLYANVSEAWTDVERISYMYNSCEKLKVTKIPKTWTKVTEANGLFAGNVNASYIRASYGPDVSELTLPNEWVNVSSVNFMFYKNKSIQNFTLPKTWTKVYSASNMFTLAENIEMIDMDNGSPMRYIGTEQMPLGNGSTINDSKLDSIGFLNSCNKLQKFKIPDSWDKLNDVMFFLNKANETLEIENFEVLSGVTNIAGLFANNSTDKFINKFLNVFTSPKILRNLCLANSVLESIELPPTWTEITSIDNIFYRCNNLSSVKLPPSLPNLTSINYFSPSNSQCSFFMPAKLPKVTTTLQSANLDKNGFTIIYYPDPTITEKSQIKYHGSDGTPEYINSTLDYSNLANLQQSFITMAMSAEEYPTALISEDYDCVEINNVEMHPNRVLQLKTGNFRLPKEGKYVFRPYKNGKWIKKEYICLYSETMEGVVEESDIE